MLPHFTLRRRAPLPPALTRAAGLFIYCFSITLPPYARCAMICFVILALERAADAYCVIDIPMVTMLWFFFYLRHATLRRR